MPSLRFPKPQTDTSPFWPPNKYQVADFMAGEVLFYVIFCHHQGSAFVPPSTEPRLGGGGGWRQNEFVTQPVKFAADVWEKARGRSFGELALKFKIVYENIDLMHLGAPDKIPQASMTYEAITQLNLLPNSGLKPKNQWDKRYAYSALVEAADNARRKHNTAWAFFLFAFDGGLAFSAKFLDGPGGGGYASVGGPAIFLYFSRISNLIAGYSLPHEIGHTFGALDHYSNVPCSTRSGYFGTQTQTQEPGKGCASDEVDIMDRASRVIPYVIGHNNIPLCYHTKRQVGFEVSDRYPWLQVEVVQAENLLVSWGVYMYEFKFYIQVGTWPRFEAFGPSYVLGKKAKPRLTPARLRTVIYRIKKDDPWKRLPLTPDSKGKKPQLEQGSFFLISREPIKKLQMRVCDSYRRCIPFTLSGVKGKDLQVGDSHKSKN